MILGSLVVITAILPNFIKARQESWATPSCFRERFYLERSKEQWALELGKGTNDVPTWDDLIGTDKYIKNTPICPGGGVYSINAVSMPVTCSKGTNEHSRKWY